MTIGVMSKTITPIAPRTQRRMLRGRPVSRYADRTGNSTISVGLEVLRIVGRTGGSTTLSEIARRAGMSLGRTSRYISSLTKSEFLAQNEITGRIDLGPAAFELGMFAMSRIDVEKLTRYLTRRLSQFTNFASIVCVWRPEGPIVANFEPSPLDLSVAIREGARISLLDHAVGQIFLAYERPNKIRDALQEELRRKNRGQPQSKKLTLKDIEKMRKAIRQDGIARTGGPDNPLLGAIAAPVFNREGNLSVSMGLVGLTYALDAEISQNATMYLKRIADRFTKRLEALGAAYLGDGI